MILEIYQIAASGNNQFAVSENGQCLFMAHTPFFKPITPAVGGSLRQLTLTAPDDSLVLYTDYDACENLAAAAIPLSWAFTGSKQVSRYSVQNGMNETVGRFYFEQTGVANTKLVIECGEKQIVGYLREVGKREVVSFYDGETQVGQLTKPNCVTDNLDAYLLHFFDGVLPKGLLALFVVYYDYLYHHHSGQIVRGRDMHITYTYDRNSQKYQKDFIARCFGKEEEERVEQFIKDAYQRRKKQS